MAIRMVKFSATSLVGTAVDMFVLWILSDFVFDGYVGEYIISPVISFECAAITNYIVAYNYVWKDRVQERSTKNFWKRFIGYNLTAVSAFLVKMAFLLGLEKLFHWDVLICNLVALCVSGLVNFLVNELVVFKKKTPEATSSPNEAAFGGNEREAQ